MVGRQEWVRTGEIWRWEREKLKEPKSKCPSIHYEVDGFIFESDRNRENEGGFQKGALERLELSLIHI